MPTDSTIGVNEGVNKFLRALQRSIGGTNVQLQGIHLEEPALATYAIQTGAISAATANDHLLQIMAGSTLNVYLRRLQVFQVGLATAAAVGRWELKRLTSAGTGGTAITANPMDATDAAAGAAGMSLSTVKGAEGVNLAAGSWQLTQTVATQAPGRDPTMLLDLDFDKLFRGKPPRITAGTANGLVLKHLTAIAAATVVVAAVVTEANF